MSISKPTIGQDEWGPQLNDVLDVLDLKETINGAQTKATQAYTSSTEYTDARIAAAGGTSSAAVAAEAALRSNADSALGVRIENLALTSTTDGAVATQVTSGTATGVALAAKIAAAIDAVTTSDIIATSAAGALTRGKWTRVNASAGTKAMTLANATAARQVTIVEKSDRTANQIVIALNIRGTTGAVSLESQFQTVTLVADDDLNWYVHTAHTSKAAANAQRVTAKGMVTITWDDGYERVWRNLLPILKAEFPNQRHSFAIISDNVDSSASFVTTANVQELYANGHEIASHSKTHPTLTALTAAQRVVEYDASRTALETMIGATVDTFVIPLGNVARSAATDQEVFGRYARNVNAGLSPAMSPMGQRDTAFMVQRGPVWSSATHQMTLEQIRYASRHPVVLNLYAHRPGDGPTGGTSGGGAADLTLTELREGLALIESLGLPVVTLRDAYPGGGLMNPGAELDTLGTGWTTVISGTGKTFDVVTDTPDAGLSGTRSFRIRSTDATGFMYAYQDAPAIEGQTYAVSGRIRKENTTTAGTAALRMSFLDQFGVAVGGTLTNASAGADSAWTRVAGQLICPVGAVIARVDFISNTRAGDMYVDHIYWGRTADGVFG